MAENSVIDKPIYPFANGSQYDAWTLRNCERCTKARQTDTGPSPCEIEQALAVAYCLDGTVTPEIAKRMALPDYKHRGTYTWDCPERDLRVREFPQCATTEKR